MLVKFITTKINYFFLIIQKWTIKVYFFIKSLSHLFDVISWL